MTINRGNKLVRQDTSTKEKKKRIDSLSRILKKLFSTFIFPRISVRFFILHNRSLRSAILLSNNVRTIVFGAASTVESETSPFFFLSFFVFFGEILVRKGSGYNNTRTIFLRSFRLFRRGTTTGPSVSEIVQIVRSLLVIIDVIPAAG